MAQQQQAAKKREARSWPARLFKAISTPRGSRRRALSAGLPRNGSSGHHGNHGGNGDGNNVDAISAKALHRLAKDLELGKLDITLYTVEADIFESQIEAQYDDTDADVLVERGATVRLQSDGSLVVHGIKVWPRPDQLREKPYYSWSLADVLEFAIPDARAARGLFSRRHNSDTVHCLVAGPCIFADFARHMQVFMRSRKYASIYLDFAAPSRRDSSASTATSSRDTDQASITGLEQPGGGDNMRSTGISASSASSAPPPNAVVLCFIDSWTYSWELRHDDPSHTIFGVGLQRPARCPVDELTVAEIDDSCRAVARTGHAPRGKRDALSRLLEEAALTDLFAKASSGNEEIERLRSPIAMLRDVLHRRAALHGAPDGFPEAVVLHLELANALMDLHQKDAAMEHCELALANSIECYSLHSLDHARTLMLVGVFDVDRGAKDRAQELFECALHICRDCDNARDAPLEAEILKQMSALQYSCDNLDAAKNYLEDAAAVLDDANQTASDPEPASQSRDADAASGARGRGKDTREHGKASSRRLAGSARRSSSAGSPRHPLAKRKGVATATSTASTTTTTKGQKHDESATGTKTETGTEADSTVGTTVAHVAHEELRTHSKKRPPLHVGDIRDDISHNLLLVKHRMSSSGDALVV